MASRKDKPTGDIGQQDGEEHHRSEEGGDNDVQRIPASGGHLRLRTACQSQFTGTKEGKTH